MYAHTQYIYTLQERQCKQLMCDCHRARNLAGCLHSCQINIHQNVLMRFNVY